MKNTLGLDADYFDGKLRTVLSGINNYAPEEIARELARLAKTADSVAASAIFHPPAQPDTEALQARIAEMLAIEKREMEVVAAERIISRTRIAELEARIAGLERNVHQATVNVIQSQLSSQAVQDPGAYPGCDACTCPPGICQSQPAPANALAIVQAALEAAAKVLDAMAVAAKEDIEPSSVVNYYVSKAAEIRAIDPKTIIDAARGK